MIALLRFALALLLVLDAALALPGTPGHIGVAPRFYLGHLLLVAVFFVSPAELRRLALFVCGGFIALLLRDAIAVQELPARIAVVPADLALVAGLLSAVAWVGSFFVVGEWAFHRRHEEKKTAKERDAMSGLYNQAYFASTLAQLLSHSRRRQERGVGLLMIDIDNFKQINDRLGHEAGDRFISEIGDFLANAHDRQGRRILRDTDYPCRVGGDEFTVIVTNLQGADDLAVIEQRVVEAFDAFMADRPELRKLEVGCSVGSVFAEPGMTDLHVKQIADQRMYEVKERHRASRESYRYRGLSSSGGGRGGA